VTHSGPEVLFKTCVAMTFVDDDDDEILTDFQNYFTVRITRKRVTKLSLKIPPHLKCVATLPCEMSSVFKATTENKKTSVTTKFY